VTPLMNTTNDLTSENKSTQKSRRIGNVVINIGLFIAGLCVSFGIAEIFFATWESYLLKTMGVFVPVDPKYDGAAWEVDPMQAGRFVWQADGNSIVHIRSKNKKLMYELRPNAEISEIIKINSGGFRDREYPKEKPSNVFRIAVVGDSVTFGWRQRLEDTYPKKLEALLQNHNTPNTQFEVLNFGIGGYNAEQEAELLRVKVLDYHPDLILIGFCPNDGQIGFDGGLWWHFFHGPSRTVSFIRLMSIYQEYKADSLFLLRRAYRDILNISQETNIPVHICIFPMIQGDELYVTPGFIQLLEQLNLPYFSLVPLFAENDYKQLMLDTVHFTVAGHEFTAQNIYEYLVRNKIVPLSTSEIANN